MTTNPDQVAVVGAGPAGLAPLRFLRDAGFRVTLFEQRHEVGGLWCFSEVPEFTSATAGTKLQISKYLSPLTDYPYPDDYPTHVGPKELAEYYHSYAEHFQLYSDTQFNSRVNAVERSPDGTKWLLLLDGETTPRAFDKLVWATGTETVARMPHMAGMDLFKGQVIHGQAYKRAESYHGQRVVVLGIGNSAADAAVELSMQATKVHISHRHGAMVLPRISDGRPIESVFSWTLAIVTSWIQWYFPSLFDWFIKRVFGSESRKAWGHQPTAYDPAPPNFVLPCVNDHLVPRTREGAIVSVPAIRRITGPHSVELDNGEVLDSIDAIIACTGYTADFGPLTSAIDMTPCPPGSPLPQLYMNVFPPRHADSVACLNYNLFAQSLATIRELMALAVVQIWTGKSALPPIAEMQAQVASYQTWVATQRKTHPSLPEGWLHPHRFLRRLHDTAGTGMYTHVGWFTWPAWKFWWEDRKLYGLVARGVFSPHIYRLFETGKRPAWKGAKEAIINVNEQFEKKYPRKGKKA